VLPTCSIHSTACDNTVHSTVTLLQRNICPINARAVQASRIHGKFRAIRGSLPAVVNTSQPVPLLLISPHTRPPLPLFTLSLTNVTRYAQFYTRLWGSQLSVTFLFRPSATRALHLSVSPSYTNSNCVSYIATETCLIILLFFCGAIAKNMNSKYVKRGNISLVRM
jgi:hypothetical protein